MPFIGSGTGPSSALYGMVCEQFFARDCTPRQNFLDPGESACADAWMVSYDEMRPWYAEAERLLGVSRRARSAAAGAAGAGLPAAPPFSADNQPLVDYLAGWGLHICITCRMAWDDTPGCTTCQTYLFHQSCKNDAARNGLLPAIAEHGTGLSDGMFGVVRLDADRNQARKVICEHRSGMLTLTGKVVVLLPPAH